jgi:hypothetical protein
MNEGKQRTPFQEAVSIIGSASVLVGLGCYVAAINDVPLVSEFLCNVAAQVYHRLPVLNALHAPQAPMLVAALTIGTVFFIFTIPVAMIIGMVPMALGLGDGGEQNAPLGRAVIGGLIFATAATLFFVPTVFMLVNKVKHVGTKDVSAEPALG